MADRYSFSLTTFNPSGKLVQIEYAAAAVSQGVSALGIKAADGVVVATEKKAHSLLIDSCTVNKVCAITPGIGMVYSGMGPDFRVLVDRARKTAHEYLRIYGEYPGARMLVQRVARQMQEATQSGGVRPFGVSLLVCGGSKQDGLQLYQVDPSGSYFPWRAAAIGKNSASAKTFLEKRCGEELQLDDAVHTALLALKEGFEGEMTKETVEIGVVDSGALMESLLVPSDDSESETTISDSGCSWDELVDRLLLLPSSHTDDCFVSVFLVFYRKCAPPKQLLDSIVKRFDAALDSAVDPLAAMMIRARLCTVLAQWLQQHPNDFCNPRTRRQLVAFVRSLGEAPELNHYYLELFPSACAPPPHHDPDAVWGLCDEPEGVGELVEGKREEKKSEMEEKKESGDVWDIPDEALAKELSRIEWSLFSRLRPRDLLRHLWMSKTSFSLVTQMIAHFNHISNWVSSAVLAREKAKHRAKTLEKFMNVAWLLRNLNNYNTLMAVLAGINNAAILRLHSTKDLVKQRPAYRYFMSLERLMSSDRSFSAYRLAMKMTPGEKIPYLGIHLQDLLSIGEGNKSFFAESEKRIHWQKFALMGDVVLGLLKCQDIPYHIPRDTKVERLILDAKTMSDEEMYKRSLEVEPRKPAQSKLMAWVDNL